MTCIPLFSQSAAYPAAWRNSDGQNQGIAVPLFAGGLIKDARHGHDEGPCDGLAPGGEPELGIADEIPVIVIRVPPAATGFSPSRHSPSCFSSLSGPMFRAVGQAATAQTGQICAPDQMTAEKPLVAHIGCYLKFIWDKPWP